MTSREVYSARRKALRVTRQQVADKANCDVSYVDNFETGVYVPYEIFESIKKAIWEMTTELEEVEHYRVKILEEAIKIRDEQDKDILMKNISHMMIELGKLQANLVGFRSNRE